VIALFTVWRLVELLVTEPPVIVSVLPLIVNGLAPALNVSVESVRLTPVATAVCKVPANWIASVASGSVLVLQLFTSAQLPVPAPASQMICARAVVVNKAQAAAAAKKADIAHRRGNGVGRENIIFYHQATSPKT
jgi:hypothetical protein